MTTKKPPAPRPKRASASRKAPKAPSAPSAPPPLKVFETQTSKGHVVLSTRDEERVAYCTPEGWLLLDDAGNAVAKTRAEAEAFVAGALGLTTGTLTQKKTVAYCVVVDAEPKTRARVSAKSKAKAREDARALFAEEERAEA